MASVYCANCNGVPRDSVDSDCCSQIYCWSCVVNGITCSFCGTPVDPAKCKENIAVRRIVDSIPTNCSYEGCNAFMSRDKMKAHELECGFKPTMCPNSDLCGIFLTKEIKEHMLNDCEYRTADCAFKCGAVIKAKDFQDHVSHDCPEVTIFCTNMCNAQMKRGNLPFHIEKECPFQPTPCEFADCGCTKVVLRAHYEDHLEADMKSHFVYLSKAVKNQSNEIKELKQRVHNGRPLIDVALIGSTALSIGSTAAQFIGRNLEAARVQGCQMFANRAGIAANTKRLLETSRTAQFVLCFVLYSLLAHIPKPLLFIVFIASTVFTFIGMCTGQETFLKKMIKIVAWACIFALIFPKSIQYGFHHQAHHHQAHHHNHHFRGNYY